MNPKITISSISVLLIALCFLLSSCKEDSPELLYKDGPKVETPNPLEGKWEAYSQIVDGEEVFDSTYQTIEMEYKKHDPLSNGGFLWTIEYVSGPPSIHRGVYEVNNTFDTLYLAFTQDDYSQVQESTFSIRFYGDELVMKKDSSYTLTSKRVYY